MSDPLPRGAVVPFTFAFTESNVPANGANTVIVRSVTRQSDDSEVVGVADSVATYSRHGQWTYRMPAVESDRYAEGYTAAAEMTDGSPDVAWQWAKGTVRQGLYDSRRQLPPVSADDLRKAGLYGYLWHTWGGTEENGGVLDIGRDLSGYVNIVLMVKDDPSDADAAALLHVEFSVLSGGGAGLVRLAGADPLANTGGEVQLTGDGFGIAWNVDAAEVQAISATLDPRQACYQVTGELATGEREVVADDSFDVRAAQSRA